MMRKGFVVLICLAFALVLLSGCGARRTGFDSVQEVNPRVRRANYVDKINAFKLYLPPGAWKVVRTKRDLLALESRRCVGKVTVTAGWSWGGNLADSARQIAAKSFAVGQPFQAVEWDDPKEFVVDGCPAAIVAGKGQLLFAKTEHFYVNRTVAVGLIRYGLRQCQFKFIAPNDCYKKTQDDFVELMQGFKRLERSVFKGRKGQK